MTTSVICPTFNRSEALVRTIESVRSQSVTDWELLVISDGCTDDTEDWVNSVARRDCRVRLYRIDRTGHPAGPRNHGLSRASGQFIAYVDHDDVWRPDHLAVVLAALRSTGADLAAGGCEYRDDRGAVVSRLPPLGACWHPELQVVGPIFEPSRVVHRRGLAERVGGWRAGIGLEDWDLWLRMADAGIRVATLLRPTVELRHDPGTRRNFMLRRHRLTVARLADAAAGRRVLQQVSEGRHDEEIRAACQADLTEWYARMAATPQFARPLDWDGDVTAEICKEIANQDRFFDDLALLPQPGGPVLARVLTCATVEHAARIEALLPVMQPRQLALIRELVEAATPGERAQSHPRSRANSAA
jgi:GT2 family glycosyltransferase